MGTSSPRVKEYKQIAHSVNRWLSNVSGMEQIKQDYEVHPDEVKAETTMRSRGSSAQGRCVICLNRQAKVALLPCKHLCVCSRCAYSNLSHCPLCRSVIDSKIDLFL